MWRMMKISPSWGMNAEVRFYKEFLEIVDKVCQQSNMWLMWSQDRVVLQVRM